MTDWGIVNDHSVVARIVVAVVVAVAVVAASLLRSYCHTHLAVLVGIHSVEIVAVPLAKRRSQMAG